MNKVELLDTYWSPNSEDREYIFCSSAPGTFIKSGIHKKLNTFPEVEII